MHSLAEWQLWALWPGEASYVQRLSVRTMTMRAARILFPGVWRPLFLSRSFFIHHNPLNPAVRLANINDPSQITDLKGFVGLTHIRGGGTGTDTTTGASMPLAFQAGHGLSQVEFIGTDGKHHEATFGFV